MAKWKDGSAKGWLGLSGHATYAGHLVDLIWKTFAKTASPKQKGIFFEPFLLEKSSEKMFFTK